MDERELAPATDGPEIVLDPSKADFLRKEADRCRSIIDTNRQQTSFLYRAPEDERILLPEYTIVVIEALLKENRILTWEVCRRIPETNFKADVFGAACYRVEQINGTDGLTDQDRK